MIKRLNNLHGIALLVRRSFSEGGSQPKGPALPVRRSFSEGGSQPKGPALSLPKGPALSLPKGPALSLPKGFSLGELLVVVTLVAILATTIIMTYQNQVAKANDAKRKEDLNKFQIAFEDYYNDNGCYPTSEDMNTNFACGGNDFAPYMDEFLCDPTTNKHYYYVQLTDCKGYKLYARLENDDNPDIRNVGCWPVKTEGTGGCGLGVLWEYNYGIAVGEALVSLDFEPVVPVEESGPSGPTGYEPALIWACNVGCENVGSDAFTGGCCTTGFATVDECLSAKGPGDCPVSIKCPLPPSQCAPE